MSKTEITGLDHSIIGVSDLEAARETYEKLGFTITRRGRHEGWGTANYCIMFPQDYIEILGIVDPTQFDAGLVNFLATNGEGLMKLAARSSDVDVTRAHLEKEGFDPSEVQKLGRWLEMPEGDVMPHFRLVHIPAEKTPGFKGFVCQHMTPEIVWREEWLSHPNTVAAAKAYVIINENPESLKDCYEKLFQLPTKLKDDILYVDTGMGDIIFSPTDALNEIIPDLVWSGNEDDGTIIAMILAADDLLTTASVLHKNGVSYLKNTNGELLVSPEDACGVAIQFI
ncbi:VOC family protein [Curvivirga aplysinae]|uniref:VOC family protein n=1 Tax=Curvivirga aplysinae TaxID=2529852 RepID=UPI0012BD0FC3|nr:VOC family protein [Curvivirga aplysinae]MTI08806.1 VOC family protein [Curvivirga aplysinae]